MSETKRPEPPETEISAPFWDATREGRLVFQWCLDCEQVVFYPRAVCPGCLGDRLEWRPSRGTGRVYAVTVEHRDTNPQFPLRAPYAVALIDVDDGARMLTNVVGCEPLTVAVGMPVALTWEALPDGRQLPQFTPSGGAQA